jgi:hypothetical protein
MKLTESLASPLRAISEILDCPLRPRIGMMVIVTKSGWLSRTRDPESARDQSEDVMENDRPSLGTPPLCRGRRSGPN